MVENKGTLTRRRFCWLAANAVPAGAILAACSRSDDTAVPVRREVSLCPLSKLKMGKNPFVLESLLLIRAKDSLAAMALTCTHQRCALKIEDELNANAAFSCPCHGSLFSERGDVLKGPATEPIPWYEVSLDDHDIIVVNLAKRMTPEWRLKI